VDFQASISRNGSKCKRKRMDEGRAHTSEGRAYTREKKVSLYGWGAHG
jgi:hypothetical protein